MAPSQFYPSWRQHVAASGELNLTSRNFARAPQDENASPEQDKPVTTADEQPSAPPAVTPPPAEAAPPKQDKAENTAAPQFEQPATKPPQENPSPKQESPTATTANPQSESPAAKSVSENAPPRRQKAAKGADPLLESPPASSPAAVLPTVQSLPTPSPDIVSANNPKEKQDTNPGSQPAPTGRQGRPARVASSKTKDDDGKPEAPSIPSDKPEETIKPTATVDLPTLPLASPTVVSQPPEPSSSRVESKTDISPGRHYYWCR
ncbi:hypothetical protein FA15DRAFT_255356 [Coprinopsis marcescibilis]|uniref:Uncharacterized protein n=1 Tax=Coprinopsis marcescibilis TaxID=230819 RepID=A0A5C3L2I5_COPMA|nr:hypothetical protein FA15DRAFT_255356 [Coprinopsis marcescibilis]